MFFEVNVQLVWDRIPWNSLSDEDVVRYVDFGTDRLLVRFLNKNTCVFQYCDIEIIAYRHGPDLRFRGFYVRVPGKFYSVTDPLEEPPIFLPDFSVMGHFDTRWSLVTNFLRSPLYLIPEADPLDISREIGVVPFQQTFAQDFMQPDLLATQALYGSVGEFVVFEVNRALGIYTSNQGSFSVNMQQTLVDYLKKAPPRVVAELLATWIQNQTTGETAGAQIWSDLWHEVLQAYFKFYLDKGVLSVNDVEPVLELLTRLAMASVGLNESRTELDSKARSLGASFLSTSTSVRLPLAQTSGKAKKNAEAAVPQQNIVPSVVNALLDALGNWSQFVSKEDKINALPVFDAEPKALRFIEDLLSRIAEVFLEEYQHFVEAVSKDDVSRQSKKMAKMVVLVQLRFLLQRYFFRPDAYHLGKLGVQQLCFTKNPLAFDTGMKAKGSQVQALCEEVLKVFTKSTLTTSLVAWPPGLTTVAVVQEEAALAAGASAASSVSSTQLTRLRIILPESTVPADRGVPVSAAAPTVTVDTTDDLVAEIQKLLRRTEPKEVTLCSTCAGSRASSASSASPACASPATSVGDATTGGALSPAQSSFSDHDVRGSPPLVGSAGPLKVDDLRKQ